MADDNRPPSPPADPAAPLSIDLFLGDRPTHEVAHWRWLWEGDRPLPLRASGGLTGYLVLAAKRLLRPLVKSVIGDLWDRQRLFNLVILGWQQERQDLSVRLAQSEAALADHVGAIEAHARWLEDLEERTSVGLNEVMRHNDALFARVDQKLDRYRREARGLWHQLGALIAAGESEPRRTPAEVQREQSYLALERRHRGSEEEIAARIAAYLPYLVGKGTVLDLGCGRGEALEVLGAHGIAARGVDVSGEMVALCREKGLDAERADLFAALEATPPGTLGGVVSFHVVEHLPGEAVERLARLAWRALARDGVLILETPSPLSLVMAARNFWIDPTHLRPIHPASLEHAFRAAGFEPVHRIDLHPFPDAERLPEIPLDAVAADQRELADRINRLRDLLDDLLFGYRDYGMVGVKP